MRNLLGKNGLSLSQAQSISNLINQKALDIANKLDSVNNASKKFKHEGEEYPYVSGNPLPNNIIDLIKEKAELHSLQAFLMEALKNKEKQLHSVECEEFVYNVEMPCVPEFLKFKPTPLVKEDWGWLQLTNEEYYKFLKAEAFASHIGQFIHKGGLLHKLRNELPKIGGIEFIEIEVGKKTPVIVSKHHTVEQLSNLHETLSNLHRDYEKEVNYYKAKVKNLVNLENSRINNENSIKESEINKINDGLRTQYKNEIDAYTENKSVELKRFQTEKLNRIKEISAQRIIVPELFKNLINKYMPTETEK